MRKWAALGVLALALLLIAVDGTVLALAIPALQRDLGPSTAEVLWIGDIYSFVLGGLLITMGTLGDRIGRKKLLLTGAFGFGLASLLAAFAPSAGWLVVARALLGVAGATIMPSTLSIIRNLFTDPAERTRAVAIWAATATAGAALGPLVGGALLEHFWWGSVFVINLPVMAALLVFGAWWLPESRDPNPGPFDLVSALLSAAGVVPLVYAVKELALVGPNWTALGAGGAGVAGLWLFVRRQRTSEHPMIDVALFRKPAFSGAVGASMIAIFALTGLVFFLSQYFQNVLGYSPLEAGLRELPLGLAGVLVVVVIGPVARLLGSGRAIALGLLVSAGGLTIVGFSSGYGAIAVALVVLGAGVGLALTLTTDAVVSAVPADKAGAASAVSETAYELGAALGIAVLGTVLSAWARTGTFTEAMQGTALVAAVLLVVASFVAYRLIPNAERTPRPAVRAGAP
ncbi:MFS transporter [Lentzea flaviverrucosa]|uniref:MFS transporter, DHA2 family, multidrug resistance protein n=1 Tax=Lentzea flaviverrucosa TaxID=200379 RepID=A0A1H9XDG0_9PSEU|nr:MFS transporter [Lentzea flaviverrucosa]RDI21561.1 DHA2 family multidrug resistance protein-like MFS transporter [Lentzea flaviverrucosa]SES44164.1 MFS transporter, DHA2 family, multidrug resistance protein [Lentzea flaviverrucosa]